ncbi:MAG: hypothetical protein Q9167_000835 [Letrouitia subvulpina]
MGAHHADGSKSEPLKDEGVNPSLSTPLPNKCVGHGIPILPTAYQSPELSRVAQASNPCSPTDGHPLPLTHHVQQAKPLLPPLPASAPPQYLYAPPLRAPGVPASVPVIQSACSLPIHPATAPMVEPPVSNALKGPKLTHPKPSKPGSTQNAEEKIYQGTRIPRTKLNDVAFKCLDKRDRDEEKRKWKRRLEIEIEAMGKEQEELFSASRERCSGKSKNVIAGKANLGN